MKRFLSIVSSLLAAWIFSACLSPMESSAAEDREYRRLPVSEYRDRLAAGWLGQMIGVGWGAPTEFKFLGQIIPEESVPEWTPERINQYNQDDMLVDVCEKLTREAVAQQGGCLELDAAGNEVFVIPVESPKPTALEQCWEPGPVANSRFTEEEMKRINPPEDTPQRSISAPKIDIQEAVSEFAPGWAVSNCGNAMSPGFRPEWGGRASVLATHPLSTTVPCVLSRSLTIPSEGETTLVLETAHDPRGDWTLVVKADGEELLKQEVSEATADHVWRTIRVDLSPLAGKTVKIEVEKRSQLPTDEEPFILEGNPDAERSFTRAERKAMLDDPAYADYRVLPNQMVKVKQRQDNPEFAAMVETVDESLGRIVAKLKSLGLEQNTIIIFTSDNGGMSAANFNNTKRVVHPAKLDMAYATSNLPLRGAKGWLYEGGIRVPLIIKWPGHGVAGSTCDEPVIGTDYYPTILDMVGVDALPEQHVDGESLCPLFHGAATLDRDAIFWHFPHYSNYGMQSPGGAIRRGRYKLLEYFENGTVQLFDLDADPGEQNDLSEPHPEIVTQLLDRLHRWREDVDAKMMGPNPDFDASAAVQQ